MRFKGTPLGGSSCALEGPRSERRHRRHHQQAGSAALRPSQRARPVGAVLARRLVLEVIWNSTRGSEKITTGAGTGMGIDRAR
ncbi:hypothetical protein MTP99_009721 [Tenebrio molitor]|jgi:hypothetical protein|nr:hypothetical protein MTP99_009721 [Tenebrio molitor]